MSHRPSFKVMRHHFRVILGKGTVAEVGARIGGKVGQNIDIGKTDPKSGFTNACALRMSYSLTHAGQPIAKSHRWATVSGGDKKQYIFRVKDMLTYLKTKFGHPDKTVKHPKRADFAHMQGIIAFKVDQWQDASGHVTLWDGKDCADHCYFAEASEASIWLLK